MVRVKPGAASRETGKKAKANALVHDETQRRHVRQLLAPNADIRERRMFGCPAFFLGRRLVACVYGDEIGLKLPAARVGELLSRGDVTRFEPYGKSMREWIALHQRGAELDAVSGLFEEAVAYAKESNA